jgi:hypothetical protein
MIHSDILPAILFMKLKERAACLNLNLLAVVGYYGDE